jgi:eukaryotic-like serine/threonine-protein kinase
MRPLGRFNHVRFGAFQLDLRARELRRSGIRVRLPDQSIQVLAMLLEHPGEVVTREEVHRKLWPNGTIVEFDVGINAAVKRLRQALEDSAEAPRYIETLPRLGYRFIGVVEEAHAKPTAVTEPAKPKSGEREGEVVSHYRIVDKIGGGGMGVVYKAVDTRLGRTVALKFLHDEFADDKAALDRFRREGRAASALNHPNICTLYDIGQAGPHPFLAMEFLEGQTLLQLIAAGSTATDKMVDLGLQITDALEAAHGKGIIHRDIKPSNIFVTTRGSTKIMDFGLAKLITGKTLASHSDAEDARTIVDSPIGTVAYMSPEQARGEVLDARTDLFSFGVVLYEMATGLRPFQGDTTAITFDAILNKMPVPPTELRPDLPTELEAIIQKALEKDRDVRFQTASDLAADLRRLKRGSSMGQVQQTPSPKRHGGRYSGWRNSRRLIASALASLVVASVSAIWYRSRSDQAPELLRQRRLTANPEELPIHDAAISPDGKYLGYSDSRGIYVQLLGTGETQPMAPPPGVQPGRDSWAFTGWYPDSTHFLAALTVPNAEPSLWSVPILGGLPKKLVEGEHGAVSADGSGIAYLRNSAGDLDREIWLLDSHRGSRKLLSVAEPYAIGNLVWSPTGNRIAYQQIGPQGKFVESCDLNGKTRQRISDDNLLGYIAWISPGRFIYSRGVEGSPVLASNLWDLKIDNKTGTSRGNPRRLTDWSGFLVWKMSATADGRQLAYLRGTYYQPIFVADLADGGMRLINARRFTQDEYINMPVGWSPNSREVIYTSDRGGTLGIYKQAVDGSVPENINASLALDVGVAHLSPDGSWILFNAAPHKTPREEPSQLYRLAVGGGSAELLFEAKNAWNLSCSGRAANRCVYGASTEDRRTLVITEFDAVLGKGKELIRISTKPDDGYGWMLSPDGTQIGLQKNHGHPNQVWFFPLDGGKSSSVEVKGPYVTCTSIDWAPDSKSVYVGVEGSHTATLLNIDLRGNIHAIWQQSHDGAVGGSVSPDGRHIAIGATGANTNVWIIDNF